jgi:hypothetical protein
MTGAWRWGQAWLTNLALLPIGGALIVLSRQLVLEHSHFTIGFSGVAGWSAVLYVLAVSLVLAQPVDRWTLPIVLAVAVTSRLEVLFAVPFLSTDIYRYVWDGVVQHAHISPYRFVPGDPALSFLRPPNQDLFEHINRRDYAHTIYPPMAQMLFYLVTWVSPTVTAMKTAMVLFEAATVGALLALLRGLGRPAAQVLLYAWCPMVVWEVAEAGHLDSAAMAFVALALLARMRGQPAATGTYLGIATMMKFYPLVLLPALWRRGDWKMPAAVAAVVALGYACYARVGMLVFGFLGGYAKEEGLETGSRYFLLDLARKIPGMGGLPTAMFYGLCAAVFAVLTVWAWKTASRELDGFQAPACAFAMALMMLFSPHYAWYVIWLVPFFTLLPNPPMLVYLMGFFYLYTTAWAVPGPKMFQLNEVLYSTTLAVFVGWMAIRASPAWKGNQSESPFLP